MKKNPLAAVLEALGDDGVSRPVGTVDFRILHAPSGLISGALLSPAGELLGQVSISGIDLAAFGHAKVGRPRADEKKLAVLLAWTLRCEELGGKRGEADEQTAALFKYSDGKKVRDIRSKLVAELGLDLDRDVGWITDNEPLNKDFPAYSFLIRKPTFYRMDGGGLEILGLAEIWIDSFGGRVAQRVLKLEISEPCSGWDVQAFTSRAGPKIISVIRPGR